MHVNNIDVYPVTDEEKVVHVEIEYPRNQLVDTVEVGLCDVRAADNIRVKYDFERDGWVILQPRAYHPKIEDDSYDYAEEWIESAFCQAWQYELDEEKKFTYQPDQK